MGERGVLPSRNQTIREHLDVLATVDKCPHCSGALPNIKQHAVATLDQLNNARKGKEDYHYILIHDPDPGVGAEHA